MGFEPELFPDDATLIREALDGGPTVAGITLERLEAEGSVRLNLPEVYAPFAEGVFPTPSGKCELYSERMQADGLDPLPTYIPPLEDPQTRPAPGRAYPLQLLSPPRPQFLNSTFANSASPPRRPRATRPIELAAEDAGRAAWSTASGPRSSTTAAVPGPRRPDRQRPARASPSPPASTGTSSPPAGRTSTAPPPPP